MSGGFPPTVDDAGPRAVAHRGPSRTSLVLRTLLLIVGGAYVLRVLDRPPGAAGPPGVPAAVDGSGELASPNPSSRGVSGGFPPTVESVPGLAAVVAPSTTPVGAFIRVHLGASPADAKILVDGAALPGNPFDGKLMKDGAAHRVQVEAPGFSAQSRLLVFDKDQSLDLALQPRPRAVEPPGMKPDPYR